MLAIRPNATMDANPIDVQALLRRGPVMLLGKLASMTNEQFEDVLRSFGGRLASGLKLVAGISLIVLGEHGLPLDREGMLPQRLREVFVRNRRHGERFTVLPEEQVLAGLGLESYRQHIRRLYTTETVCETLGVTAATIREWIAAGLACPVATVDGVWQFDFAQVGAAKKLCELSAAGVSLGRIRRSLKRLREWMPQTVEPLQQLAILEGRRLLIRTDNGALAELDGQLQIDFDIEAQAWAEVSPMRLVPADVPRDAADWRERGMEQEQAGHLREAAESYRQALLAGGPDAQTIYDLAHLLSDLGKKTESAERYLQAVEIDPKFIDAWLNLGVVLSELGDSVAACQAFRRALALDPHDLRALYNLADELEERGLRREAQEHWREYLRREQSSDRAAYARQQLRVS